MKLYYYVCTNCCDKLFDFYTKNNIGELAHCPHCGTNKYVVFITDIEVKA